MATGIDKDPKSELQGFVSQEESSDEDPLDCERKTCLEVICRLIKKSSTLQHLDLSQTYIKDEHLEHILKAISVSKSLNAIHLCANPFINADNFQQLSTNFAINPRLKQDMS